MGFAAKLAAAQDQPSPWGGGPPQQNANQGQYGAPYAPYGAPPPSQYGAPPPSQYGAPPPHQYGAPSPQYGAHPPQYAPPPQQQPGFDVNTVRNKLESMVVANGLQTFYPPSRLHALAEEVSRKDLAGLARRWRLPTNVAQDLITLALYDIIIFADDSGSMAFKEWNGERIEDLKALLTRIADAATLFDSDGISVRFMNGAAEGNNLATAADVERMMSQIKFGGMTPLGTQLERKVLKPLVLGPAKTGQLRKPVSIIVITDGEPTQESPDTLRTAIKHTKRHLSETKYGPGAVAFQFAQVGRDEEASKFLGKLDTDPKVGGMVDCTSYIELEQQEYQKKGLELTPELYLVKLLCGAIDKSYDSQDEEKKKKKSFLKGLFA